MINLFYDEVTKVLKSIKDYSYELLFVDDGSTDKSLDLIKILTVKDDNVLYISLSRNFGKEAAMYAGLSHANGDYIGLIDVDLQDPPELLRDMVKHLEYGYDVAATRRVTRKGEPLIKSFFARTFYKIINKISNVKIVDGARDYRLMKKKVVKAVLDMKEYNRFSKGIFSFVGFKTVWIEYENKIRAKGTTKWSFFKLFKYSLEGIIAFSTTPLIIASIFGILFFLISIALIFLIIFKTFVYGDPTNGWPSLVCIIFMISGIQLFFTGIIGSYLAKTYLETKKRPIYIIDDTRLKK